MQGSELEPKLGKQKISRKMLLTVLVIFILIVLSAFLVNRYTGTNNPVEQSPIKTLQDKKILFVFSAEELGRLLVDGLLETFKAEKTNTTIASTSTETSFTSPNGETAKPDANISMVHAEDFDVMIIGCRDDKSDFLNDQKLRVLVREADQKGKILVATESAPLILARAGILSGKKVAAAYSAKNELEANGAIYANKTGPVISDNIITHAWLTDSMDCERLASAIACVMEEPALYQEAVESKSAAVYKQYLRTYPEGFRSDQIREVSEPLIFNETVRENSVQGYREYLEMYPVGYRREEILDLLDPVLFAWAKDENTIQSYEEYLNTCSNGTHADEAGRGIEFCRAHKAEVTAEHPSEAYKENSPWSNVESPIWRWEVTFEESNGIRVNLTKRYCDYISSKGHWYDPTPELWSGLIISPRGSATDDNWVSSPSGNLCGATACIKYTGLDEHGNEIEVHAELKLLDQWR